MRTKLTLACASAAFAVVAGGTAEATGLVHTSGIAKGAVTFNRLAPGVQKMLTAKARAGEFGPGANGLTGRTWRNGRDGADGPDGTPRARRAPPGLQGVPGANGADGEPGHKGLTGDKGDKGDPGIDGTNGTNGANGAKGDPGAAGTNGADGADSDDLRPVTATQLNGFTLAPNGDNGDAGPNGSVTFAAVANAPKGAGVLDMQTITGKSVVAYLPSAAGRLLSELTSFGYASNVISAPNTAYDVTAQIEVVKSAATAFASGYTTVVFEPYVNGNQGTLGWHRNDVVHGKVWSTKALPSGDCSQAVPCPFSQFIAENPQAIVLSAPKFRIGQNSGTPANDAGHYQVDDVIYGFGTAVDFNLGA